jgi:DNA invertase Pin-like site-specific DNA recombinase
MVVIREYAKKQGFTIVKEYSDQGKSGLNMEGRESLGQMLQDVKEGRAEYSVILVCDISEW